ncbi:PAS domain S-box protein [Rhodobacterales bacterium]|nr:PAS domain S-box protein [Rhodobacterales bacterium]
MARDKVIPTGVERFFSDHDIIVSKTDTRGRITYANKIFRDIAGMDGKSLQDAPHSIIRHPDMPRCVFKLIWDTIQDRREIFGYVKNLSANGDHYWVFAHVTPSFNEAGEIIGYHSNRRVPNRQILDDVIIPLYDQLNETERKATDRKTGLKAGYDQLLAVLESKGMSYDELVHTL